MQETFSIDQNTGDISLRHTVDREQRDTYRLSVQASDGLHDSQASLILVVQDANDNIPTFAAPSFSQALSASGPRSCFFRIFTP